MTSRLARSIRPLVLLLAVALAAACVSGGGARSADVASASPSAEGDVACDGDCRVRVENRLDRDVEVSTDRQRALPALGIVREDRTETFELPDFTGQQLELWIRDEDTEEIVGVACVRQFRMRQGRKVGQLVLGAEVSDFGC